MKKPRILIVRGGAIGDFIMTLPAIGALRAQWPETHIEILGYPHITELARGRYYADATRSIEARPLAGFFVPRGDLNDDLFQYFGSFDLVISYLFDPDGVFAQNVRLCEVQHLIEASPKPAELHAAAHYCKPLEALAIYVNEPRPKIFPNEADRAAASKFLQHFGREPIFAIHPGSGSEKKNWPVEKFGALARRLVDEMAGQLLIVQGEADERPVARLIEAIAPRAYTLGRGLNLVELAAVLERCALFVGNDSGITHLAAAVGTPTVAVFGPASPAIWQPRGERVRVAQFGEGDTAAVMRAIEELMQNQ